jgi:hypothetical protein
MKRGERPFMVGRRTPRTTTMVLLSEQDRPVFRGPWKVRAVVRPGSPR